MTRPDDERPEDRSDADSQPAPRDDDAAWREIVAHYGDRPALDDPAPAPATPPAVPTAYEEPDPVFVEDVERFVPPPPPAVPRPPWPRALAWGGVLGAPAVVLLLMLATVDLPTLLDYAVLVWFVGGFLYLVATMSRTPRDPWDDGSRV